jgi:hypothetical protein
MHPLAWVAIIILCLFGVGLLGIFSFGMWVARNPARAVRRLVTATNSNLEVVSTDDGAGTITLRDRRTGKVVTMSFDQARRGNFHFSADDGDGRTAEFQVGGEVHLPSWLPAYPGSHPRGLFSATGDSGSEGGDAGGISFTTSDSVDQVLSFYEDKAKDADMHVNVRERRSRFGKLEAKDEDRGRGFSVEINESRGESNVKLVYGRKL